MNINLMEPFDDRFDRPPRTPYTGTPLHRALGSESAEYVRFLPSRGAERTIKGVTVMTPLDVAEGDMVCPF